MTAYSAETTIGARIRAARKSRGFRTPRELAEAMPGSKITEFVIENIEAGRKADLPISTLLSIAKALQVPPALLLAPLAESTDTVDLPNVSDEIKAMRIAEFDAWLSGNANGAYRASSPDERRDLLELEAFRDLQRAKREISREHIIGEADRSSTSTARLKFLESQTHELTKYLTSSGWMIDED